MGNISQNSSFVRLKWMRNGLLLLFGHFWEKSHFRDPIDLKNYHVHHLFFRIATLHPRTHVTFFLGNRSKKISIFCLDENSESKIFFSEKSLHNDLHFRVGHYGKNNFMMGMFKVSGFAEIIPQSKCLFLFDDPLAIIYFDIYSVENLSYRKPEG